LSAYSANGKINYRNNVITPTTQGLTGDNKDCWFDERSNLQKTRALQPSGNLIGS